MKNKKGSATSGEMLDPTKTAESATPEGMPEDAKDQAPGTTDTLFPEHMAAAPAEGELPAEDVAQSKDSSSTDEAGTKAPEGNVPEILDLTEFGDRMVKTVVDGVEKEIPLSEALKGYQTAQHLAMQGHKIGEERKSLEQLRAEILDAAKSPGTQIDSVDDFDDDDEFLDPHVKQLKAEISQLKELVGRQGETLSNTAQVTAPIAYQNSLKVLDKTLQDQGFDDFMQYVPQIEEAVMSLPVEQQTASWNMDFFSNKYAMLKLRDLQTGKSTNAAAPPANPDQRPAPNVVPIESANSRGSRVNDSDAAYKQAVSAAKQSGDWTEVFRMKGIAGFNK